MGEKRSCLKESEEDLQELEELPACQSVMEDRHYNSRTSLLLGKQSMYSFI